jgi:putative transposase
VTSNHVHLLVTAMDENRVSQLMDSLEGDFAQVYNLRTGKSGAFWSGRYHATAIGDRAQLWNCLAYIDLNMVRAGAVDCPSEWPWCSYGELTGSRKRYRLIDQDHFERAFGSRPDDPRFQADYAACVEQKMATKSLDREPFWSDSLAVGSESYLNEVELTIARRRRIKRMEPVEPSAGWVLKETPSSYRAGGSSRE